MSKKKKNKKNKKAQVQARPVQASEVIQATVANKDNVEPKLLASEEEQVKLENKSVDLIAGESTSTTKDEIIIESTSTLAMNFSHNSSEEKEGSIAKQESELKQNLEKEAHVTLESEAEHRSHVNESSNNIVPFLTGVLLGGFLMYLFL